MTQMFGGLVGDRVADLLVEGFVAGVDLGAEEVPRRGASISWA
jgi:hypothetical protein